MIRHKKFVALIVALYLIMTTFALVFFLIIAFPSLYGVIASVITVILIALGIIDVLKGGGY